MYYVGTQYGNLCMTLCSNLFSSPSLSHPLSHPLAHPPLAHPLIRSLARLCTGGGAIGPVHRQPLDPHTPLLPPGRRRTAPGGRQAMLPGGIRNGVQHHHVYFFFLHVPCTSMIGNFAKSFPSFSLLFFSSSFSNLFAQNTALYTCRPTDV